MRLKKILKVTFGALVFITLPSLLLYAFLYYKYNEPLPIGTSGEQADALAHKMLNALDYDAYKNTDYIEWTFKKRRHYKWYKSKETCDVLWKDFKVNLNLKDSNAHKAYVHGFIIDGEMAEELIEKAINYFNNDSFWLVAPYKVFDEGVERKLVSYNNEDALLVTYETDGIATEDSYLWLFDSANKPKAFKMWTSLLPIDGIEATWNNWITTESGAQLPQLHRFLIFGLEIDNIKTSL
ncbi:hypothetical protein [Aestuariivivens sp. NBU2969]|uniref:hypothetical protein n=1 Tax=Aestuariivivens sp. NBU2969 TaxID=2873267 RepID=UPI001CBAD5D2|nr:hypothetical protein [Aestuariivivens sp. NBU2969]